MANRSPTTYDFFIAHDAADSETARTLYEHLNSAGHKVFLDEVSLLPGDRWDVEIPVAQQNSRITVVLVSPDTQDGYYDSEEIAAAIDLARRPGSLHRVIPVYLTGDKPWTETPYGLRRLVGLFLEKNWLYRFSRSFRETLNPQSCGSGETGRIIKLSRETNR